MKKTLLILVLLLAVALTACGQAPTTAAIPTVQLDAGPSQGNTSSGAVTASAEVVPASKVELSFPTIGTIQTVDVKVGDTVTAGQALASLNTVILEAKVAEAEANVATADTQVRYLRRVGPGQEQLDSAKADLDRANAALEMAKAMLAQATLVTPIDGTVVSVELSVGETATPGLVVVVVGDLSNMQIETTDLSERDVPSVKVGQSASVFIEALNETFTGKVVGVARQATTVGGDTVYKVTVELDEQPQGLLWGMSAEVEIQTEQ
ncbi:MAG: efflux RND transporter periplasmic adaptor subunit [Chloroflexi bacterium]|nr:efflux RND transporter periplasmic adaptor subunit [Chloroflexota bacterium]